MRKNTRRNKTRLTLDGMCRLYGVVCVVFKARLVFPRINDLTVYLILSCLFPSTQFVVFMPYISLGN